MSRVCSNVDCDNGEIFDEEDLNIVTCPDCGSALEEFDFDPEEGTEEEEEPEEDAEEDGWDNSISGFDDSVD